MCFPANLAKFLRTPSLKNTSGRLLLFLAYQKQLPEVFYENGVLENLADLKKNTCGLQNFQEHLFYRTPLQLQLY